MNTDFSTKELLQAFDSVTKPQTFLNSTFFSVTEKFVTEKVEVQYRKGGRAMAPIVSPLLPGKVSQMPGYEVSEYKPATLKPARLITAADLQKASFGENVYSTRSPEERHAEMLAKNWVDMQDEIQRRLEYMSRQVLFEGKIDVIGDGVSDVIDFGFKNKVALSGNDVWNNYASDGNGGYVVDPIEDIEDWRIDVLRDGGGVPNVLILAPDVAKVFMGHPAVKEKLESRRNEYMAVKPEFVSGGVMYLGQLSSGLELYTYNEWVEGVAIDKLGNETKEQQALIPEGQILLASTNMKGKTAFGAVSLFNSDGIAETYEAEWVPRMIANLETGSSMKQELISNPLIVPDNINGWLTAKVVEKSDGP